jgi:hypothetical protein
VERDATARQRTDLEAHQQRSNSLALQQIQGQSEMKKKSKYKPKGIRLDALNWVLAGLKPVSSVGDAIVILKAKNHSALTEVVQGRGNRDQIDVLIAALNMCEAYAIHGKGKDWLPEINEAQNALYDMAVRGLENDKFLFRGPEMQAVNLAMDVHDVQLEESTVKQLEDMANFVAKQVILKRARAIVSKTERQSNAEQMQPA